MSYPTSPQPLKVISRGVAFKTRIIQFEDGSEQRQQVWPTGKMSFRLQYDMLTQAEMQTLWDYYVAQSGAYSTFSFTDPVTKTVYSKVRYAQDNLTMDQFAYLIHRGTIDLIQVF